MPLLEHELQRFQQELPQLLRTMKGQFVLIHGDAPDLRRMKSDRPVFDFESFDLPKVFQISR